MASRLAWIIAAWVGAGDFVEAAVQRPVPLRSVLAAETWIFTVRIDGLQRDPARMQLAIIEHLKGRFPRDRLSVDLRGGPDAERQREQLLLFDRLAAGQTLVVFGSARAGRTTIFAFTNGTWFRLIGDSDDAARCQFQFANLEPYLRRTYKGGTDELRQIVVDGLSGRRDPPPIDSNEPPGLGPPVKR
jgi:hypothetical protein